MQEKISNPFTQKALEETENHDNRLEYRANSSTLLPELMHIY